MLCWAGFVERKLFVDLNVQINWIYCQNWIPACLAKNGQIETMSAMWNGNVKSIDEVQQSALKSCNEKRQPSRSWSWKAGNLKGTLPGRVSCFKVLFRVRVGGFISNATLRQILQTWIIIFRRLFDFCKSCNCLIEIPIKRSNSICWMSKLWQK